MFRESISNEFRRWIALELWVNIAPYTCPCSLKSCRSHTAKPTLFFQSSSGLGFTDCSLHEGCTLMAFPSISLNYKAFMWLSDILNIRSKQMPKRN